MRKSIYSEQYRLLLEVLRESRTAQGFRQEDLVKSLALDQSTISRIELGERRLDVVELRAYCQAIGIGLAEFIAKYEMALLSNGGRRKRS